MGPRLAVATGLLALAGVVAAGVPATLARWSDAADVRTGEVRSGAMDLQVSVEGGAAGAVGLGTGVSGSEITWTGLSPGEQRAFDLTVANVGDPPLTWQAAVRRDAGAWTYSPAAVVVRLHAGRRVARDTSYPVEESCTGSPIGPQRDATEVDQLLTTTARRVAAGGSDPICLVVGLAADAGNANQGAVGSLLVSLTAEQAPS